MSTMAIDFQMLVYGTPTWGEIRRDHFKRALKYSGYQVQNTEHFIESILHRTHKKNASIYE